ncbi:MAG: hypothetical protein HY063_05790 [Bacteroidetes bacterium]|nr:hypothetical protein [Bacteroidota bacterium]
MPKGGVRKIIISGMNRQQLVSFIKRKDKFYSEEKFHRHSDKQLRELAHCIDDKIQAERKKSKETHLKILSSGRKNIFLTENFISK